MATVTPISPPTPEATVRRMKVDRYGELDRLAKLHVPDKDEQELLKEEIQSWHKDAPGDMPAFECGDAYRVNMTARRNERTITDPRKAYNYLKKELGIDGLIAVLTIALSVVDKNVPKSAQHAFITEERSGYRTFSVVQLNPAFELLKKVA